MSGRFQYLGGGRGRGNLSHLNASPLAPAQVQVLKRLNLPGIVLGPNELLGQLRPEHANSSWGLSRGLRVLAPRTTAFAQKAESKNPATKKARRETGAKIIVMILEHTLP